MQIVVLLPLLNLFLFILFAYQQLTKEKLYINMAQVGLLAAILWAMQLVLLTEMLSFFKKIEYFSLVIYWSGSTLFLGWLVFPSFIKSVRNRPCLPSLSFTTELLIGSIIFIMLITSFIALFSPPNNWDSMSYHLTRVMHWQQSQSVNHYSTHFLPQLYQNPLAEFVILHLQILSGSDQFVNLVQWFSMVGSIVGVGFITQQLGANLEAQILATFVAATIPMGMLQAVTTQNDYVASFWIVCFISFILATLQKYHFLNVLGVAGSLGLVLLTKGTAYLFTLPFIIAFGYQLLKTNRGKLWQIILMSAVIVLLINSCHYYRNLVLFGNPLKPRLLAEYEYANQVFTPAAFTSTIIKNIALHISTPTSLINHWLEVGLENLHQMIHFDLNDPRTTWFGTKFEIPRFRIHEDTTGNLLHLMLAFVALIWSVRQKSQPIFSYAISVTMAFLLFAFYLKWQPWNSRLHLPLFVLLSPVIAIWLSGITYPNIKNLILLLLIVQTLPYLFINPSHRLIGQQTVFNQTRIEQYFVLNPTLQEPYQMATQLIINSSCRQVGLVMPGNSWEYPIWVLLGQLKTTSFHLENIAVNNESSVLANKAFEPCVVICLDCQTESQVLFSKKFGPPRLVKTSIYVFVR